MFTGLVHERGRLLTRPTETVGGGRSLTIGVSTGLAARLEIGASLAVAGVCLTVVELAPCETTAGATPDDGSVAWQVRVDLAPETLARTRLGALAAGDAVNLEPALRMGDALGGHLMQGHVDGLITVLTQQQLGQDQQPDAEGTHREVTLELPANFAAWVAEKGSVALDGVSLTVAALGESWFRVALIPHTLAVTTLGSLQVGQQVHFEADVLAKYVAKSVDSALRGLGLTRATAAAGTSVAVGSPDDGLVGLAPGTP